MSRLGTVRTSQMIAATVSTAVAGDCCFCRLLLCYYTCLLLRQCYPFWCSMNKLSWLFVLQRTCILTKTVHFRTSLFISALFVIFLFLFFRYKDGQPYPWPSTHSQLILYPESANQTIYTTSVSQDDAGNYTCFLKNETVVFMHTIHLTVYGKLFCFNFFML